MLPQGSGRTDAGVHALAQVASFALASPIPPPNLRRALNRALPPSIRIMEATHAPSGFHARHSAIGKQYEIRIYRSEICPPQLARYVYALAWPLDIAAMQQAAPLVLGTHDFSSFAAVDPDRTARMAADLKIDNVRTLTHSAWHDEGDLLIYTVRGDGFLHHMVRNLVGTFLEIGRGQRRAAGLTELISYAIGWLPERLPRRADSFCIPSAMRRAVLRLARPFSQKMSACEICRRSLSVKQGCSLQRRLEHNICETA